DKKVEQVLPVQAEVRGQKPAPRQRRQHTRGDVPLGEPDLRRLEPVHLNVEGRVVHDLPDVDVGGAGDAPDEPLELLGDRVRQGEVVALDLDVDRRRQAEVEHLADDVARLEVELVTGVAHRQDAAELSDVPDRRRVLQMQADQDVG